MGRLKQVIKYGWKHACLISKEYEQNRIKIFMDIIRCYLKYDLWSNQYLKYQFWSLSKQNRDKIGHNLKQQNQVHEKWVSDYLKNKQFLFKYTSPKYEIGNKWMKRSKAYEHHFMTGSGLVVDFNVIISRQHNLNGVLNIGKNLFLGRNTHIDYSGDLTISDNVGISEGVLIETHSHPIMMAGDADRKIAEKAPLIIENDVKIGARSIIVESCNKIGRYARIGAGSVVRKSVPRYSIVLGNPAKIVGFLYTPQQMVEFEAKYYPEGDRTSYEEYSKFYEKFMKTQKNLASYLGVWVK